MSGPKTVALPPKTKASDAEQQSSPPRAACCERIRELAYIKWEAAGCPCGDGVEFWLAAEAELLGDVCSEETTGK
jgi:hypothetical protein